MYKFHEKYIIFALITCFSILCNNLSEVRDFAQTLARTNICRVRREYSQCSRLQNQMHSLTRLKMERHLYTSL